VLDSSPQPSAKRDRAAENVVASRSSRSSQLRIEHRGGPNVLLIARLQALVVEVVVIDNTEHPGMTPVDRPFHARARMPGSQ